MGFARSMTSCHLAAKRLTGLAGAASLLLCFSVLSGPSTRASDGPAFAEYAVAADNVEASEAGARILAEGGNAADAAAATMLALGVASPSASGLGGGGFALYYRASDKSLTFLDFRERAPSAATPDMYLKRPEDAPEQAAQRSRTGGLSIAVPGEPAGVEELVKRFGKLPLKAVVKPAQELAERGYTFTAHTARVVAYVGESFLSDPLAKALFGGAPQVGSKIKNPALAKTLAALGNEGARAFYRGSVARQILQVAKAHGGLLSAEDLAAYRVVERKPLQGTRFGFDWVTAPPPSAGGYTILQSLSLLERTAGSAQPGSAAYYHALIESWKGPYLDRQYYFGDPNVVDVPLEALNSEGRVAERSRQFHPVLAMPSTAYTQPLATQGKAAEQPDNRGTTHLCVVDREGNIASVTTTVNLAFGSRISAAGLWLNDEMDDFAREVGEPNAFGLSGGAPNLPAPGKRPVSSMVPSIVFKDGSPVLCVGGSGGSRIITAVQQVAMHILLSGLHPSSAIAAPRVHHQASPSQVDARDLPEAVYNELERRGHTMRPMGFAAHVQAIRIGEEGPQRLLAGSDANKGGEPRGL